MARPKIGIFGALVAVGGVLALRWAQKHRAAQARLAGELTRWEGEGGAVAAGTSATQAMSDSGPGRDVMPNGAGHGAMGRIGGTRDAWIFPHGHS
ncbi:hypothetical protein AB1286_06970 [Trinickia sp. NRRL B-1857]|uniref:hypothetical protein n=1 Tax=Trinickia sp. NRRL B-1857 TaxID=3162879 RepID=UPI003D2D82A7